MKRAAKLPQYADMKNFSAPSGVVEVTLDKVTNRLATASCPQTYTVAFIAGTEPKETCEQAAGDHRGFFSKIFGLGSPAVALPPPTTNGVVQPGPGGTPAQDADSQPGPGQQPQPKKKPRLGGWTTLPSTFTPPMKYAGVVMKRTITPSPEGCASTAISSKRPVAKNLSMASATSLVCSGSPTLSGCTLARSAGSSV